MPDAIMWYVAVAGQQQGPFGKEDLIKRIQNGELTPDTLVYAQGITQNWVPISSIEELAKYFNSTTPKAPPVPTNTAGQKAHVIDYKVFGDDLQFVEIELDPGEAVVAEAGAMMYMEDGIEMEAKFGDGSQEDQGFMGKLLSAGKRLITGESLFMTHFTNKANGKKKVAFGAPYPGKIVPVDLKNVGGTLLCQKDAFLSCAKGIALGIAFQKKIGVGLFGGEGFIMQKLEGDGLVFMHAGGTIIEKTLAPGQQLKVDTGCIVAYQPTVNYDVQFTGGIKTSLFGGEGLFLATLTGPGKIWLQSLPFSRLADRIYSAAPQTGGKRVGEGSILGGLGDFLDGD